MNEKSGMGAEHFSALSGDFDLNSATVYRRSRGGGIGGCVRQRSDGPSPGHDREVWAFAFEVCIHLRVFRTRGGVVAFENRELGAAEGLIKRLKQ